MPDMGGGGIPLVGTAANFVGGTMQAIAAAEAAKHMREAFGREIARQGQYRNQAFGGTFEPALPMRGVEEAGREISTGAAHRRGMYEDIGAAPLAIGGGPDARDRAAYSLSGQARAQLGGYSDWQLQQMIKGIRTQDELNRISNFAAGTAGVFPYRMYDAQHSMDALAAAGGLISSIGGSSPAWSSMFAGPQVGGGQTYGAQAPAVNTSTKDNIFGDIGF